MRTGDIYRTTVPINNFSTELIFAYQESFEFHPLFHERNINETFLHFQQIIPHVGNRCSNGSLFRTSRVRRIVRFFGK